MLRRLRAQVSCPVPPVPPPPRSKTLTVPLLGLTSLESPPPLVAAPLHTPLAAWAPPPVMGTKVGARQGASAAGRGAEAAA